MRIHTDTRRTAYCGLFDQYGDTNLFIVNPGQRTCWHRHQRRADQFVVLGGQVRFGYFREEDQPTYRTLSCPEDGFVWIPPGMWHGYENFGDKPAYLLMYLDRRFDETDEERMSEDEVPWSAPR